MSQQHLIGKTTFEINPGRLGDMNGLQQDLSQLFWQQVLPEMEQLFDQLVGPDEVIRLEQLVLTLPPLGAHELPIDFVPALMQALRSTLRDHLAGYAVDGIVSAGDMRSRVAADWEIFLYFLDYGRLPWWSAAVPWSQWLERWQTALQNNASGQASLRTLLVSSPMAAERLIGQFSGAFRHQLLLQVQPTWVQVRALLDQAHLLMQALDIEPATVQRLDHQAWWLLLVALGASGPQSPMPDTIYHDWLQLLVDDLHQQAASEIFSGEISAAPPGDGPMAERPSLSELPLGDAQSRSETMPTARESPVLRHLRTVIMAWTVAVRSPWLVALNQVVDSPLANPQPTAEPVPPIAVMTDNMSESVAGADSLARGSAGDDFTSLRQLRPEQAARVPRLPTDEAAAGLYLNQAGIVLLHPFLPPYFEGIGLLAGRQFQDEACQQTAIYLLHYLATGATDPPEYELVLPKLLCGWPLDTPVVCPDLPPAALEEAEHLLQAAIDHWQALKSTRPDGLREGFLQREGKLTCSCDRTWKLQVEQQAIDVLLSRLPWSVSIVKLPWMDDLLTVEWV
ncbi:MAG: contractile injection system tape measure protein [Cyanobacteria bacterium P01_B01_bin.77]